MNGTREESVIFSMQPFTVKLASGVAVFLAGLVVDWIHLDTAAAVQTQDPLDALRLSLIHISVGIENFEEIRKLGFYYIDKTRLIEQLLQGWGKVTLFTRPRRCLLYTSRCV